MRFKGVQFKKLIIYTQRCENKMEKLVIEVMIILLGIMQNPSISNEDKMATYYRVMPIINSLNVEIDTKASQEIKIVAKKEIDKIEEVKEVKDISHYHYTKEYNPNLKPIYGNDIPVATP